MTTQHFDLCVIGSGSANSMLDERFSSLSIAMVERSTFGGTCLNKGCIPSKMFIYPADVVDTMRHVDRINIAVDRWSVDFNAVKDRTFGRIDPISKSGLEYRQGLDNISVLLGDARFVADKTLQVGDVTLTADRFVIAAGARTTLPDLAGLDRVRYRTSDDIMRLDKLPERLTILGSGFIACEMAHVFDAYGSEVTLVIRRDTVLNHCDRAVSDSVTRALRERFRIVDNAKVTMVEQHGSELVVSGTQGAEPFQIRSDELLIAIGRTPNGDELGVQATGVRLDDDGYVVVDRFGRTSHRDIWALGDVCSHLQLKHVANHQAKVVAANLAAGHDVVEFDLEAVPFAIFTAPQVGVVGCREEDLKAAGSDYVTITRQYGSTAYGWAMEDTTGFVKLLGDPHTRQILGAHVVGYQASNLVQLAVFAMRCGHSADELATAMMYPHPALTEVIENAALELCAAMDAWS